MRVYRQGAVAPDSYALEIHTGTSGLDMTTVSAVSLKAENPDGSEQTWTTSLSGASVGQVTATYAFPASPSPFIKPGQYRIHAVLTVPGGTLFSEETRITVLAPHEVQ